MLNPIKTSSKSMKYTKYVNNEEKQKWNNFSVQ